MNLKALLVSLQKYEAHGPLDVEITGLSYDSKKVQKGNLFAALPGVRFHGSQFLSEAERSGAAAVLTDRQLKTNLTQVIVQNARLSLALLSAVFHSNPSHQLRLFGVTGTNGKTTSTFLLRSILSEASMRTGLVGTIQYCGAGSTMASTLTTPESLDLQRLLGAMVADGCEACVIEVSS
ncbi:MAG TPA: Mur ligase family protein, partial [Acidobacteriota bacterium]|nr:Mur ligase family protein [Acidobacteriota bacterium]